MVILSYYMGNLGVKSGHAVTYKSKNAKIEISLTPLNFTIYWNYPQAESSTDFSMTCIVPYQSHISNI